VTFLLAARSSLAVLLTLASMAVVGFPWLYLVVVPAAALRPERRRALVSWYMKGMTRMIFATLSLGGARFRIEGRLPTSDGILIVMNHQSLVDILVATSMADPYVPAFVPRLRYARFVPLVSRCIRLLECPIVDPKRDARGAVLTIRQAALRERYGLLLFPEGHRSRDGALRPFKTAGIQAILEARRLPVYLVVGDGLWRSRRLVDFMLHLHGVRCDVEVLGPFEPPASAAELPAAVERWRGVMLARLEERRRQASVA
jgi:1-acyl-sn-glycerol-3-phosphate acyltransferase